MILLTWQEVAMSFAFITAISVFCLAPLAAPEFRFPAQSGTFQVGSDREPNTTPETYHLKKAELSFNLNSKASLPFSKTEIYNLTFDSPFKSAHPENNKVHAEYYVPSVEKNFPATIVLDITGGDQSLSRSIATHLASRGVGALFVQMAYYGPRRPPGSGLRLLSPDLKHTYKAIQQTVLDVRAAVAWLKTRPEVNSSKIAITGTSLGSMIGALSAEMEPDVSKVIVLLGGGGLIDGYLDHPAAKNLKWSFQLFGGKREDLVKLLAPVDPLTKAENLKTKQVIQFAGSKDEIVPPIMAKLLWEQSGKQVIYWYDCGHYSAAWYLFDVLQKIVTHLKA